MKDRLPNRSLNGPELAAISRLELIGMMERDPAFAENIAYAAAAFRVEAVYELPSPHPGHNILSRAPKGSGPDLTGKLLQGVILEEFDRMIGRDYIFGLSAAYRRAKVTLRLVVHLGDPREPDEARTSLVTGEAPMVLDPPPERTSVIGLQRVVSLDNPNIDRINHGMPIIVQVATPPLPPPISKLPGEPPLQVIGAPGVENKEFHYDRALFESPTPPIDSDISKTAAAALGIPIQTGV